MVKIHCDRCGKEIKDRYYTIDIDECSTTPTRTWVEAAEAAVSSYAYSRTDMLCALNSTKMYCRDCVCAVKEFIDGGKVCINTKP